MSQIELKDLTRHFGSVRAVVRVNLVVPEGEFFSLIGPSGCGKTTVLRMIAGFLRPSGGEVVMDGQDVTGWSPQRRNTAMVFQNYALFPHMTVYENVVFGLESRKDVAGKRERVAQVLDLVRMADRIDEPVTNLSGGQQQRVALARAVVVRPRILLFDEPLSNLDVSLRENTIAEIRSLQRRLKITTIYVTHDQKEAFALSDRIGIMNDGALVQIGPPREVYEEPVNRFVAGFMGNPNVFPFMPSGRDGDGVILVSEENPEVAVRIPVSGSAPPGNRVYLSVRPELVIVKEWPITEGWPGQVTDVSFGGAYTEYRIAMGQLKMKSVVLNDGTGPIFRVGDNIGVHIADVSFRLVDQVTETRERA